MLKTYEYKGYTAVMRQFTEENTLKWGGEVIPPLSQQNPDTEHREFVEFNEENAFQTFRSIVEQILFFQQINWHDSRLLNLYPDDYFVDGCHTVDSLVQGHTLTFAFKPHQDARTYKCWYSEEEEQLKAEIRSLQNGYVGIYPLTEIEECRLALLCGKLIHDVRA